MATKILSERWDEKIEKWETHASFETFDSFYEQATKFKENGGASRLRVHIPGGFKLTSHEREMIEKLRIERF
jgi:hypothetical protein